MLLLFVILVLHSNLIYCFPLTLIKFFLKALKTLGLLIISTSSFTDIYCLNTLYYSLVSSILQYWSIVWCPFSTCYIEKIKRQQRRFLRFICFKEILNSENNYNIIDIQNILIIYSKLIKKLTYPSFLPR